MKNKTSPQAEKKGLIGKREPYEAPAIIYEGQITTRSGSPDTTSGGSSQPNMDPANIFNGGG